MNASGSRCGCFSVPLLKWIRFLKPLMVPNPPPFGLLANIQDRLPATEVIDVHLYSGASLGAGSSFVLSSPEIK